MLTESAGGHAFSDPVGRGNPRSYHRESMSTPRGSHAFAVVLLLPLSRTEPAKAWHTQSEPVKSAFRRDDFQLVFTQFDERRPRLALDADAIDLYAARSERTAKLYDTRSEVGIVLDFDVVPQL